MYSRFPCEVILWDLASWRINERATELLLSALDRVLKEKGND
jgi:hypothetical protein